MKILKKINKKLVLLAFLVIAIAATGITYAYLKTNTENLNNKFTVGEITTNIEEDPKVNGTVIEKNPKVVNEGPNDAIVRMRVTISPKEIKDYLEKNSAINYDKDNWKYNESDGFWYYQKVLPYDSEDSNKSITTPLFTKVTGLTDENGNIINEFKEIKEFQITLYQESVQATVWNKNGDKLNAFDENGDYNQQLADKIWNLYDTKNTEN